MDDPGVRAAAGELFFKLLEERSCSILLCCGVAGGDGMLIPRNFDGDRLSLSGLLFRCATLDRPILHALARHLSSAEVVLITAGGGVPTRSVDDSG